MIFTKPENPKAIILTFLLSLIAGAVFLTATDNFITTFVVLMLFLSVILIILYPEVFFGIYASGLIFTMIMWVTYDFNIIPTQKWGLLPFAALLVYMVKDKKVHLLPDIIKMSSSQVIFAILLCIGTFYAIGSFSDYGALTARRFFYLNLFPFIGSFFFYDNEKKLRGLFFAFIVSFITLSLITYHFYLNGFFTDQARLAGNIGELGGSIRVGRVTGFAALAIISFLVSSRRKWIFKALLLPLLASCFFFMLYSGTRGALIAFLLSLFVLLIIVMKNKGLSFFKRLIIPFSVLCISGAIVWSIVKVLPEDLVSRYLTLMSSDMYYENLRITFIKMAAKMFVSSPIIGCGTGSFFNLHGTYPHNIFLEIITSLGLVGFSVFVYFIIATFSRAFKSISMSAASKSSLNYAVITATIGFVFYLTEAQFSFDIILNGIIWFFAGFIWAAHAQLSLKHVEPSK